MKKLNYTLFTIIVLLVAFFSGNITAQEVLSGTVKYQETTKFKFERTENQRRNDFLASMPSEIKSDYVLHFEDSKALYEENNDGQDEGAGRMRMMKMHVSRTGGADPKPSLKKVYYDLKKNTKIEQLNFMTRNFIVKSEIESKAWKLTNEKSKILGYLCMSAQIIIDNKAIKAWFTPEIPLSVGPDVYTGLPGLVLAVEKEGETIFLASSVEIIPLKKNIVSKPKEGKKVTHEELNEIIKAKIEEFKKTGGNRRRGPGGGGRRHM